MIGAYLKKRFSKDKDVPEAEQFFSPLRIGLNSTIDLETIDIVIIQTALHPAFVLPEGRLSVLAIGKLTIDDLPVYQIYVEDENQVEFVLQIVESKDFRSGNPEVGEITLYHQIVTLEPESEVALDRHLANLGFETLDDIDGVDFNRIWGDRYTEKAEFRRFDEKVITPQGPERYDNQWLLYDRKIDNPVGGDQITEYLLVGLETGSREAQIMMQLGLKIRESDITVQ